MKRESAGKLRVLHLVNTIRRGGAERQLHTICSGEHKVENLVGTYYTNEYSYFSESDQHKVYVIPGNNPVQRFLATRSYIRSVKPDVIYAWAAMPYAYAALSKIGTGAILINGSIRHGVFKMSIASIARMMLLHVSRHIVANSKSGLRANLLRSGYVLYNGVSERFNQKNYQTESKNEGSIVLCSIANLVPYKDYETVLKALARLKLAGYDFYYYIIGDGPLKDRYLSMINDYGLESKVTMLGRVMNPEKYLAVSDVFVHSSKGEGCSNAILEAMYMGLPIIASDTGGTKEIVKDNGVLFQYRNVQALEEALVHLMRSSSVRRQMGQKSHAHVGEYFSEEAMVERFENLILSIGKEKTKRDVMLRKANTRDS